MQEKTNPSLTYPLSTAPEPGKAVQIQPGIQWIRLPIPFELNHINVWLLEDGEGYTLIDTGISSRKTCETWQHLFDSVIKDRPVNRVIVTHFHPDHFGLARWLCERTAAAYFASSETLERTGFLLDEVETVSVAAREAFYRHHGVGNLEIFENFLTGGLYTEVVSGNPESCDILKDGDTVSIGDNEWRIIMTYGHAPGHINLYCEALNMLISGDQLLPTITSNVSVYADQPDGDPLKEYIESFRKFESLPADTVVLPSHGKVFAGVHTRIREIVEHHDNMLEKIYSICEQPHSVMELVPRLYRRKLEGINTILAFGETLSHLNYLCAQQKLQRGLDAGRYIYRH